MSVVSKTDVFDTNFGYDCELDHRLKSGNRQNHIARKEQVAGFAAEHDGPLAFSAMDALGETFSYPCVLVASVCYSRRAIEKQRRTFGKWICFGFGDLLRPERC